MRNVLVDSGALVALFNVRDHWHEYFDSRVKALEEEHARLFTTWPCVTEATHVLEMLDNRIDFLSWITAGGASVRDFRAADVEAMSAWMRRYSDRRGMDFADATLMWLAIELESNEVLTVDHNDFERYRLPRGRRFAIL